MLVFTVSFAVLAILLYRQGWKPGFLVTDALLSAFLLTAAVWTSSLVVKAYPTRVGIVVYGVFVGAACGLFVWFADMLVLRWWFEADREYHDWIQKTADIRLALAILTNSWMGSLTALNNRSRTIEAEFRNMTDATTLHREAELFKLRQQLQPHFLYNSLNSISALIMIQPEKAQEMIGSLSDFLRNSVKREGREQIPVAEELQYIGAYLAVEAVRFGDRLKVVYDKGFDDKATMPPFLLQPILENAIKFGLYGHSDAVVNA